MKTSAGHDPTATQPKGPRPSDLTFPVVGIGASAGGLQAIKRFFKHMPSDSGMGFVVVLHLSPDHDSIADRIIQECTRMPVKQVSDTLHIEQNHVYVISPASHLAMDDGYLKVSPAKNASASHGAIDLFFRDLADAHQDRAFCIVLSGTGADGAVGLARIKEKGGITLAQAPEDAEFDDMPRAAIGTRLVDLVLPVAQMPAKLVALWSNAQSITLPCLEGPLLQPRDGASDHDQKAAEQALHDILLLLRTHTGHDFKHYKRATVLRRIERRLQVTAQHDLRAYYDYLERHPEETKALLGDMLIGVTNFFRDSEAFEALERHVIAHLGQLRPGEATGDVRIWSAGCSTGEEAYSLAILASEQLTLANNPAKLQVFATDLDERAIAVGRAGLYPEAIATDVLPARLRQNFHKENQHYRVRKEIREKVLFAKHNLLSDPPFSQIDLIVCRNLLIYLDREVQREILQMFHFALRPGGYLFLGSSESADICLEQFVPVDKRNRIFRAKAVSSTSRSTPSLPRGGYVRHNVTVPAPRLQTPRKVSFADIHQRALAVNLPPSMIVDSNADILHVSEGAGRFLRHVAGELSSNLLILILPQLRLEARTTLFQVQQSGQPLTSRKVQVGDAPAQLQVELAMQPYRDEETDTDVVLVVFQETSCAPEQDAQHIQQQTENQVLASLERELQRTKVQLQDTIEQSEVSSEELKASNEEMQAVNEELRSATEELETSKEELQSINEELLTVNFELKTKVEETDKVNDYLTNLIASTDIATVFVDRNMHIRWFTPRATDIFNMLPVDTGRSLLDITHRLDYPQMVEDAASVFDSLNMIEREVSSSDQRWYIARLLPYRSSENHIDGTVLTFIDITSRRAAEEDLRLGEERMRLVAESTHDFAIIILDEHGVITDWNTGAQLIFGYSKAEVIGAYYDLIFAPEDRAAGVPENELRSAREQGRGEDERWHLRKDGSRFYCSGEVTLLKGDSLRGYVKIARDLTGHKRLHEEQSKKLEETRSTSHLKDEFFAVMSHELKHPLNLIQLNAEILRRMPAIKTSSAANKAVGTINDAVISQARIIDDLLDVARIRTGKLKLKKQPVDLLGIVRDIHTVFVSEQQACKVTLQLPPATSAMVIDGDSTRLEQIIWNLLNNAVKFSPDHSEIRLVLGKVDAMAQLQVIDRGVGLPAADLNKIFDLFSQSHAQSAGRHREGLGVGLSLVRQLTEAHGGSVTAQSAGMGQGSTFTVRLPLSSAAPATEPATQARTGGRLSGLKILLVDDSIEVLEVMKQLLEMEDATVVDFSDPQHALEQAADSAFDVIISDIGMPGIDGYQLIKGLREHTQLKLIPAIALSGYGDSDNRQKSRQSGFDRHLGKPVAYEELIDTIEGLSNSLLY